MSSGGGGDGWVDLLSRVWGPRGLYSQTPIHSLSSLPEPSGGVLSDLGTS